MDIQPQNPEFRNNPEDFYQCRCFQTSTMYHQMETNQLTLKAPIMTAADNKFFNIFPNCRKK